VRKYIDCYLDIKEGAVYPDFARAIVPPFAIPNDWQRLAGFDKGFRDETTLLLAAINPKNGDIYCYKEYYEKERPISYHANKVKEMTSGLRLYLPIQADPTIRNRNERDGETYQSYFQKVSGIYLSPGNNDIDAGIDKVRDYIYLGKLKFFDTLENLKNEANNYVYHADKDKPIDKSNHLLDALRYMIMQLPSNPHEFNGDLIRQSQFSKQMWSEGWEREDDEVLHQGNVYMLKGGIINEDEF
jgi:phage terminase large subunit